MNASILIVEDDPGLRKCFTKTLEHDQYKVLAVQSAEEAFTLLSDMSVDLVLSDVVLKGKDGMALCRELRSRRETSHLPVILVSGHLIEEMDQVQGLESGADDYLLKPISGKMLSAKIESVLRRYRAPHELAKTLEAHGLTLDVQSRIATLQGHPVALTRKEFDLLTVFISQPGEILSHEYLLEWIWGVDPQVAVSTRTLTVHVSSLRNKLGEAMGHRIASVPRLGYRFQNER